MSASNLPEKKNALVGQNAERRGALPAPYTGEGGAAGYGYYTTGANPMSGKEQIEKALDMLFRRKWIVLVGFLLALVIATVYTMTRVPEYEATSFVLLDLGGVELDIGRNLSAGEDGSDPGLDLFARSDRSLSGEIRLLEISDQLVHRVVRRFQGEEGAEGGGNSWVAPDSGRRQLIDPGQAFSLLNGWVQYVPERGSDNIIGFVGRSSEAARAALLANLYAEEYVGLTEEASRSSAFALRMSLEEQEKEKGRALAEIEDEVQRSSQGGAIRLDQEASGLAGQIALLEVQLDDAYIELRVEKESLRLLQEDLNEISPQLAERIAFGGERRIEILQEQLAADEDDRTKILLANPELREGGAAVSRPPALIQLDGRIEQLRAEIDSLVNKMVEAGGPEGVSSVADLKRQIAAKRVGIGGLEAKVELMENRLRRYESTLARLPAQSMELAQLERSRVYAEERHQSVLEQLQEARITEESKPGYAQVIRIAQEPFFPVYPDPYRNLILGAFLGLLLGLALAVVRDKLDNRIYQPEQLRQRGLKEIGIIPSMKSLIQEDFGGQSFVEHNGQQYATTLVTLINPVSASSEAYRYLRTNIRYSFPETNVQTLMITSPGMSEGKTTSAANLAIVMAQSGRRTLLVDADLRRPQVHRTFGLKRESGLTELLSNGSSFGPDAWKTSIENLFIMTAGSQIIRGNGKGQAMEGKAVLESKAAFIVNPSELLGSEQMQTVLAALKESFDLIIIDTPPVLAATDAVLLSAQCDATIIVARAGVTKEGELDVTVEALQDVGARIIGTLLNGFDVGMAYGHKYKYQHYTRYGRYSKYGYYGVRDSD